MDAALEGRRDLSGQVETLRRRLRQDYAHIDFDV
jgi:hypothetical protein